MHEVFGRENTKAAGRQKHLLLDLSEKQGPVDIADIDHLSPRLAKAYAGMNPRTLVRDVEVLEQRQFIVRDGKTIRANTALIAQFLPIRASCSAKPESKQSNSQTSISLPPPSVQSRDAETTRVS